VNGDGYADVVVGAYIYDTARGRAYVFTAPRRPLHHGGDDADQRHRQRLLRRVRGGRGDTDGTATTT